MKEFFIYSNSFAAPFISEQTADFVKAETPRAALEKYAAEYKEPAGLYAAACYASADAYHKGAKPLARWVCNHAIEKERLGGAIYFGYGPGDFEIDGVRHIVENPKQGRVV